MIKLGEVIKYLKKLGGAGTSREEFELAYAQRSGVTVQFLHSHMLFAVPCDCGDSFCNGWQMIRGVKRHDGV